MSDLVDVRFAIEASAAAVASRAYVESFASYRTLSTAATDWWAVEFRESIRRLALPTCRILDVGCGVGRFTTLLATCLGTSVTVVALDKNEDMVLALGRHLTTYGISNVRPVVADIVSWQTAEKFDIVFISEVLQLIADRQAFFAAIARIADAGAIIIIRTPSHEQLRKIDWLAEIPHLLAADLARTPDLAEIAKMLRIHGFVIEDVGTVDESVTVEARELADAFINGAFSILALLPRRDISVAVRRIYDRASPSGHVTRPLHMSVIRAHRWPTADRISQAEINQERPSSMSDASFVVRHLSNVPREAAHGGSGGRQVIFSRGDGLSPHLEAVTKGFLEPGAIFDWHDHEVDEFFLVLSGTGLVFQGDESDQGTPYGPGDVFYCKTGLRHKIASTDSASEYIFVRLAGTRE